MGTEAESYASIFDLIYCADIDTIEWVYVYEDGVWHVISPLIEGGFVAWELYGRTWRRMLVGDALFYALYHAQ